MFSGAVIGRNLALVFYALFLAEAARRTGDGLIPFVSARRISFLERSGAALLLGWGLFGAALLGLALTGLFSPAPVAACVLLAPIAARGLRLRDPAYKGMSREISRAGWAGPAVLGAGLAVFAHRLLTPETDSTAFLYHLALPWNYLLEHRALLSQVSWSFHIPVPVDIGYAPALLLGDDRVAKWQAFSYPVAAGIFYAGGCLRRGRPAAAWAGPLLALSIGYFADFLGCTKNDLPASAFFVVGALLTLDRTWTLGALFLGLSVAAKFTYAPMAAVWVALMVLPHRRPLWAAILLLLPILPWCLKSQLAMGNPLHPLTGLMFDSFEWGPENRMAAGQVLSGVWGGGSGLRGMPERLLSGMRAEYLLVLAIIPGLLMFGARRKAAGVCILAMLANFVVRQDARYILPGAWLLVLFAAWEWDGIPPAFRGPARLLGSAYAIAAVFLGSGAFGLDYSELALTRKDYLERKQPIRQMALEILRRANPRRVLVVGDWRSYPIGARPVFNGYEGETPLVWKAVKESGDLARLARKIRQLGVSHIYYNHVTAVLISGRYSGFSWDRRMIRLYAEYCRRFQSIVGYTDRCDYSCGGYYIYEISRFPRTRALRSVWFAPGMESIYAGGLDLLVGGRNEEALEAFQNRLEEVPDVGQAWNNVGLAYYRLGDYANAARSLEKFVAAGMLDEFNLVLYGAALVEQGRLEEGEKALLDARDRCPQRIDLIDKYLAQIETRKAAAAP